jgi:hypothetical protein
MPVCLTCTRYAAVVVATLLCVSLGQSQQPMPTTQTQGLQPTASALSGGWEGVLQTSKWPTFMTLTVRQDTAGAAATLDVLGQTLRAADVRAGNDSVSFRIGEGQDAALVNAGLRDGLLVGRLSEGRESFPFSLRRIPAYPKPKNRVEAWSQDIDALMTRFIELDQSFSPAERSMFLERLDRTKRELPQLNDNQVIAHMASAIAIAHNAHTRLYLVRNSTELRRLPVRLWWFSDGLRVVRTTPDHRGLLGCRVDNIGGVTARKAHDMVAPAFAGNSQWVDYMSVYSLTTAELLNGFGVTQTADSVVFSVSDCVGGGTRVVLKPLPLVKRSSAVEAWWDLSPRFPGADSGWVQVLASRTDELPLYLTNPKNYWFEYLPSSRILYFQYNRSQNMPGETVAQFGERLLAAFEQHKPRGFVLDVRFNTGGNLTLSEDLMKRLIERTASIARYVITSRVTFSAGISAAAAWAESGNITIVGEPVGDELEMWAEGGNVRLPNSGFKAHFANGLHSYSMTPCPVDVPCTERSVRTLRPDIPVNLRWKDYLAARDPAMEAVIGRRPK